VDRKVLITGGSGSIGDSIVKKFKSSGYNVCAPVRSELDLESIASIKNFTFKNKSFDILINNAGVNEILKFTEFSTESIEKAVMTNLTSAALLSKYLIPSMSKNQWGRIVNVSSIFSKISKPKRVLYTMTKSGLNGLTIGLANEYAREGILVNAVLPGFVDSSLTRQNNSPEDIIRLCSESIPVGRLSSVEEVADLIFYLGTSNNSYITGQTIAIDGGVLIS
jgi:3-oxoacyl-[acyl-carrier protein] reductase